MNSVFLDTSGLVAIANTDDQWHDLASKVWSELIQTNCQLVTSSLVLIELADGLSRIRHRKLALQIIQSLQSSPKVQISPSDSAVEQAAWQLFSERMDKEWGMTDCVSMTLMSQLGIAHAFTADSHFEQAGFEILLKTNSGNPSQ